MKQSNRSFKDNVIIALRFVSCAIPGFFIFLYSAIFLWVSLTGIEINMPNQIISILLLPVGLLMTLYGLGKWGQWKHLTTIILIPIVFFFLAAILDIVFLIGKDFLVAAAILSIPLLFYISRRVSKNCRKNELTKRTNQYKQNT